MREHLNSLRTLSSRATRVVGRTMPLAIGEIMAGLGQFGMMAYIARELGVAVLGEFSVARALALYIVIGTDMGSKAIGARMVARDRSSAEAIVSAVQRKRILLACVSVLLCLGYAFGVPSQSHARWFLCWFALSMLPYGLTLEWLAWGLERYWPIAAWRSGVNLLFLAAGIAMIRLMPQHVLDGVALANGISLIAGAILLWIDWRAFCRPVALAAGVRAGVTRERASWISSEIQWSAVLMLGSAALTDQLFQSSTLFLGAMVTASEVGLFSGGYRIFIGFLRAYHLFNYSLYPVLARWEQSRSTRMKLAATLGLAGLAGLVPAAALFVFAKPILAAIYGPSLREGAPVLRVLAIALPLAVVSSFLEAAVMAAGGNGVALAGSALGAAANVGLNLLWIPKYGIIGSAWAAVVSYLVLTVALGCMHAAWSVRQEALSGHAPASAA